MTVPDKNFWYHYKVCILIYHLISCCYKNIVIYFRALNTLQLKTAADNMGDTSWTSNWKNDNLVWFASVSIRQHNTVTSVQKSKYSQEFTYVASHRFTTPVHWANRQTLWDRTIQPLIMFSSSKIITFQLCNNSGD